MGEGGARVRSGVGHGGITCVLQTQFSSLKLTSSSVMFHLYIAVYHAWMAIIIIVFV